MATENQGLHLGQMLEGRYRIISDEGQAIDIATEYRAYDVQSERVVVVLVLDQDWGGKESLLERLNGLLTSGGPLDAPAVLPVRRSGLIDGRLYVLRDHVKAHSLAELRAQQGALGVEKALELAIGLCDALAPLHRSGRVHGSLSPHSVLIDEDSQVLVTDAGLCLALRSLSAQEDQPWGRLPYVSPEQVAGQELHPSSDVYVIGTLLYEMVSDHPLYQGDDQTRLAFQHLSKSPPVLQSVAPHVPLALAQIVHKALSKEPSARYRNAGQLAHILRSQVSLIEAQKPPAREAPQRERPLVSPPAQAARPVSAGLPVWEVPQSAPPPVSRPVPAIVQTSSMVVPPPPRLTRYEDLAHPSQAATDEWEEEMVGADWLMVGLAVLALIAVLGLIPLWRQVYQRYAIPPDAFSLSQSGGDAAELFGLGRPWVKLKILVPDGYEGKPVWEGLGHLGPNSRRPVGQSPTRLAVVRFGNSWLRSQDYGLVSTLNVN